jgi:hypothetical protein
MEKRFLALRVCGTLSKILAWFFLIAGILLAFVALITGLTTNSLLDWINLPQSGTLLGVVAFLLLLILSILLFLGVYSLGELFFLALAVEENTRRAAYLAQQEFLSAQGAQQSSLAPFEDADAAV